jgi:hypothetical protein
MIAMPIASKLIHFSPTFLLHQWTPIRSVFILRQFDYRSEPLCASFCPSIIPDVWAVPAFRFFHSHFTALPHSGQNLHSFLGILHPAG